MYKYPSLPKRVFYVLFALFLAFQSYGLCEWLFSARPTSWQWSIILAFLLNLFVTGVFAFLVFALPTERLLPDSYYHIKRPKKLQTFGKIIGIEGFRRFLLATVWKNKEKQKGFFDGTTDGLDNFETNTKKSDFGHMIPFIILNVIIVLLSFYGKWITALTTLIINIVFNFYPIILQRLHRIRIERMRKILRQKEERKRF